MPTVIISASGCGIYFNAPTQLIYDRILGYTTELLLPVVLLEQKPESHYNFWQIILTDIVMIYHRHKKIKL